MINESTGAFPDAAHRPAQRWPGAVLQGQYPLVLDALRADGAAWCTAAPCLRPRPCIDPYDTNACRRITKPTRHLQRAQAPSGNHCGRRAGHHGEGWPGATRRRRWRSALTIATARRREPRCATEATDVRPIVMPSAKRFGAPSASLGSSCMCIQKNCRKRNVSLVFLSAARASVI